MPFPPVPRANAVLGLRGLIAKLWDDWFQSVWNALNASAQQLGSASVTTQSAAIAATPITTRPLSAGFYRVSSYAQITRAAGATSALAVDIQWTYNGVAQTTSTAALTGNATTTHGQNVWPIAIDAGSSVTYTTSYLSLGVPSMTYALFLSLEGLPS